MVGLDAPVVAAGAIALAALVPQLRCLATVQDYRQWAAVAGRAIERFLAQPVRAASIGAHRPLPPGRGRLEFVGLGHGSALADVTAVAEPDSIVAVVGADGLGRSTLLALAAGLLDPDRGRVAIDGVDPAALHPIDLRRAIGLAGPELPLLPGSLRRNLTYRVPDADEAELAEVIGRCDLTELVSGLPDGLDTVVAEGGTHLSIALRRRLLLARAALGRPRLLLLDEADATLDHRAVEVVERLVIERTGTTILVTNDPRRLALADQVWCLDRGRLVDVGPPAEVLRGGRPTARLFRPPPAPSHRRPSVEVPGAGSPGAQRSGSRGR